MYLSLNAVLNYSVVATEFNVTEIYSHFDINVKIPMQF